MSESEQHRNLVRTVGERLKVMYAGAPIVADIQSDPGAELPPTIDGFRPDVFVRNGERTAIAEAKTDADVDRTHTHEQVKSFIACLEDSSDGLLVLSVTGSCADRAKTVLRFIHLETKPSRTRFAVFDQCDVWLLQPDGVTWELFLPARGM